MLAMNYSITLLSGVEDGRGRVTVFPDAFANVSEMQSNAKDRASPSLWLYKGNESHS